MQRWQGTHFCRTSLAEEGLRFQVGHSRDGPCPLARSAHKNFVVLHTNGIHRVNIDFCGCWEAEPDRRQLLEVGWIPATPFDPQTCATVPCMRQFHTSNLQGKLSPYDYYKVLELLTDPFGFLDLPVGLLYIFL